MLNNLGSIIKKLGQLLLTLWQKLALFVGSLVLLLFVVALLLAHSLSMDSDLIDSEVMYSGTKQEIAYVRLSGEIAYTPEDNLLGFTPFVINPARIRKLSDHLAAADQVQAVILDINSPGGSVAASEEVYQQLLKLSRAKPLYVYFGETAASGAYYISLPADKIYASVPTITGSIGVIAYNPDLSGLYENLGIAIQTYQTGPYKDIGSFNRPAKANEEEIFTSIINDAHQLFIDRIQEHRPLDHDQVVTLADGRIYSGRQAVDNGLVDELGSLDSVMLAATQDLELDEPTVREYYISGGVFANLLGVKQLDILPNSILSKSWPNQFGLYYLWVH